MQLAAGDRLGPYEILAPIGAGGMGEVYRARDVRLKREVALKILPSSVASDSDRVARFAREAELLAALNHPNIANLYGVEQAERRLALVMELVEGDDLAARIARGPVPLDEALPIARQIADALEAAHERGIIHRDLKPANVKVRPDGTVKVLDFGLAKEAGPADPQGNGAPDLTNSPTMTLPAMTATGVILGTAAYMSPEQARGRLVDKRTDIWSFGCVLFEMLSGQRAFHGETTSDLITAILSREPELTRLPATTPPAIRRLLQRCFAKDARRRLRDIGDARAEIEDALLPAATAPTTPGATESSTPARWWLLVAAGLVVAAVGSGLGWFAGRESSDAPLVFDRIVKFVSTAAHEYGPAISPDGKWVAYLSDARGPTDVWVKFVAGGDPVNLTASAGITVQSVDYVGGLDISPDGTQIAVSVQDENLRSAAWLIPAPLGGVPRRLLSSGNYGVHWSPDGKRIAFVRAGGPLGDQLVVADADGQKEQVIAKREGAQHIHWIRWSPDARWLYFNHGPQNFNIEPTGIFRVAATGGALEPVVATARRAAYPFPSPDGRGLIYAANPDSVDLSLWWRDLATGRSRRLTAGVGEYTHPVLSTDGRLLIGTVMDARQALDRVAVTFDRPVVPEPLTDGYTGDFDPALSPDDDRLVFSTSRTGNRTLWSASTRLERPAPLTGGVAFDERPVYSPDGREIAFVSDRGERRGIWIVSREGGTPRLLAYADVIDTLSWSPDGRRLVYATPIGDAPGLMIVNVADGTTTRLPTPAAATGPAWSRDDVIAYVEPRGGTSGAFAQLIAPDGRPVTSSPLDGRGAPLIANGAIAWSPDGKRLAATSLPGTGVGSVWIIDPNNAAPYRKLLDLPAGAFVRGIAWTRDGSSLILGRYRWSGDIFLAERSSQP